MVRDTCSSSAFRWRDVRMATGPAGPWRRAGSWRQAGPWRQDSGEWAAQVEAGPWRQNSGEWAAQVAVQGGEALYSKDALLEFHKG